MGGPSGDGYSGHEQHIDGHLQRDGDALDVVHGNVANQAFGVGDESAVQARFESQRLLGPTRGKPRELHRSDRGDQAS